MPPIASVSATRGELRETRRFNLTDREVSGGYYHPLGATWTALLEASMSPDRNVLPQHALFGQVQKAFDGGSDIQAGVRHSRYSRAATDLMTLAGERYWGSYRAATLRWLFGGKAKWGTMKRTASWHQCNP